jgi:crotonobetaine/carnitine-CoA ligase
MTIDRGQLLPFLVRRRGLDEPAKVFLQQIEGDRTLTYGEAHRAALRWAHAFGRLGVGHSDTVCSMLPVGFDAVHCWVGLTWLVAWEVPVNTSYQGQMLAYTLENSNARLAVVAERYLDRLAALGGPIGRVETVVVPDAAGPVPELPYRVVTGEEFLAGLDDPADDFEGPQPWDVVEIFYTSGTTGPSKGVLYTHTQQWASASGLGDEADEGEAFYCPFPMYHVSGKVYVYNFARLGIRGVFREYFKTDEFWADVEKYRCTSTLLLGAMANFVYRQPPRPDDADTPLRKVMMVPLIPELADFERRFGVEVTTVFNMTEISCPIVAQPDEVDRMPTDACGRIREGYECRVVDEHDLEVPRGELGELVVRADQPWVLNAGYFNMPDKTAEAWRNGWFHTGDGFVQDEDGWFHFVDRKKDAIRRRGENISSMEVESLVNAHPGVLETAAIAVPSDWGEDEVKVVVVRKENVTLDASELHAYLLGTMPKFMVPRYIEFVDALPKTPTEKVRKVALREEGVNAATWDSVRRDRAVTPVAT